MCMALLPRTHFELIRASVGRSGFVRFAKPSRWRRDTVDWQKGKVSSTFGSLKSQSTANYAHRRPSFISDLHPHPRKPLFLIILHWASEDFHLRPCLSKPAGDDFPRPKPSKEKQRTHA
jgi:hypothetical protein